jgi:hypothetical protein
VGGENDLENLSSKLAGGILNVLAGGVGFSLNSGAGLGDVLLRDETGGGERCILLRGPLLDAKLALVEDLSPGGAKFGLVLLAFGVGCGDGGAGRLKRAGGAGSALGEHPNQRTIKDEPVGNHQDEKNNHGRHRAEHKFTELTQEFIYHDFADSYGWNLLGWFMDNWL